MGTLSGKIVIVTGAASEIGAASARRLYEDGAAVVAADLSEDGLAALAGELEDRSRFLSVRCNVGDKTDAAAVVEAAADTFGTPSGLVNCAGIKCVGSVLDVDPEDWDRVMLVNVTGTLNLSQAFARKLASAGAPGAIVNFSSGAGLRGVANRIGYVASKFAVTGMTYTMALELAATRIRVNAVAPGMIRTPFTEWMFADPETARRIDASHPIGRAGQPQEVAATVSFLLSDDASFITGAVLPVDGGSTVGIGTF